MSASQRQTQVVPAQLAFLAIYSPTLGPTDETFADQLVFYYSRTAHEARAAARRSARNDAAGGDAARKEENERLRQIGLAQGMVDFARGFSEGMPVDSIDTEKSRIVLHELEKDWWVLASIDLTRLPVLAQSSSETTKQNGLKTDTKPAVEYSSREVSPPALLLQQLLQAHYIFTLHHGPSLSELFVRTPRDKFCSTLERYWNRFARSWDVLLHGNPAVDVFSAIKLSSGGELGMGVGEEEWGSGEREVLEDLTHRTEGLVDMIVSRFGEPQPSGDDNPTSESESESLPWMGSGAQPLAADGLVFGGVGSISRRSLRNISLWMRQIYSYGEYAYGVRDAPNRDRRKRRRRNPPDSETGIRHERRPLAREDSETSNASQDNVLENTRPKASPGPSRLGSVSQSSDGPPTTSRDADLGNDAVSRPGIPPPIATAVEKSLDEATHKAHSSTTSEPPEEDAEDSGTTLGIPDQYMKYLTFGLSTFAKPPKKRPEGSQQDWMSSAGVVRGNQKSVLPERGNAHEIAETDEEEPVLKAIHPIPEGEEIKARIAAQKQQETSGHFVIGLKGDLNNVPEHPDTGADPASPDDFEGTRMVLRTLQIQMAPKKIDDTGDDASSQISHSSPINIALKNYRRLRVLIYVHRPFMYCLLFENRAPSLSMARFYKDLHQTLLPIHKPLLSSTSAAKVARRLEEANVSVNTSDNVSIASGSRSPSRSSKPNPIYDLIYDPSLLTVHTSVPNIPEPGTPAAEGINATNKKDDGNPFWSSWTRVEALNAHSQILNTLASTQRDPHEYERTSKTNRGWWVVWMKLPPLLEAGEQQPQQKSATPSRRGGGPDTLGSGSGGGGDDDDDDDDDDNNDNKPGFTSRLNSVDSNETVVPSTHIATSTKHVPQMNRIAFLIRKASDAPATKSASHNRSVSASTSLWNALSLRPSATSSDGGAAGAAKAASAADNVPAELSGGMGFDARKYVEGLLSLNR